MAETLFSQPNWSMAAWDRGRVEFLLDDGEPVKNVPRSLKGEGHKHLGLREMADGHYVLTVEKGDQ